MKTDEAPPIPIFHFPMHTIIPALSRSAPDASTVAADSRQPLYEISELGQQLKLDVFIPGVDPSQVEIATRGPDLTIVARKPHPVRVNFSALHLETAQRDYELRLRLGHGFDFNSLHAEMRDGVLRLVVPKRNIGVTRSFARRVA